MIFDTISQEEHENLIRNSERLSIIQDYLEKSEYPSTDTIKILARVSDKTTEETTESEE